MRPRYSSKVYMRIFSVIVAAFLMTSALVLGSTSVRQQALGQQQSLEQQEAQSSIQKIETMINDLQALRPELNELVNDLAVNPVSLLEYLNSLEPMEGIRTMLALETLRLLMNLRASYSIAENQTNQAAPTGQTTPEGMNEKLILESVSDVYNDHNFSAMEKYFAKNFTSGFTGLEDFNATKRFLEQSTIGMPDMTAQPILTMSEGDTVLAFIFWNGTWTNEAFGMMPTGQVHNATTAEVSRILDGKIVEQWQVSDVRNWPFRGTMNVEEP